MLEVLGVDAIYLQIAWDFFSDSASNHPKIG
jgi:hypothetical protein